MPSISAIDSVPDFITPEQHAERTGSTPSSFADISPVLRHKEENIKVVIDPPLTRFSEEELSKGTLYVIESVLVFVSQVSGHGFKIDYPAIILHAVSRDPLHPHVYCQLADMTIDATFSASNGSATLETNGALVVTDGSLGETEVDEEEMRELHIIPQNINSLEEIFDALSHCAALHPDPDTSDEDMYPGDGFDADGLDADEAFVDADVEAVQAMTHTVDDEPELSEAGREVLARLNALILDPNDHLHATKEENEQFSDVDSV